MSRQAKGLVRLAAPICTAVAPASIISHTSSAEETPPQPMMSTLAIFFLPFCQDELVIATPVPQHYLEMQNHAITFQDFMKDPIIIREKGSGTKKEMDLFLERIGITPSDLNVIARMNDLEGI